MQSSSTTASAAPQRPRATYRARQRETAGFPLQRTALVVIDPVNDYLSEGGAAWELAKTTVRLHDVVGHLRQAIAASRERGVAVIHAPTAYTAEDYEVHRLQGRSPANRLIHERRMFIAGSWGADFHRELRPAEGEVVLLPHKGCDAFETDLPEHLERLGATHLVIAGMTANLGCEATGRRAVELGYDLTFVADAIGAESVVAYEAAVRVNYPLIANAVMTADEYAAALAASTRTWAPVRPGDTVVGTDRGVIGSVERVEPETADCEAHLAVSTGLLGLGSSLAIPLDAVTNRAGGDVYVNVPKAAVAGLGWTEAPTHAARRHRNGPPEAEVARLYASCAPTAAE